MGLYLVVWGKAKDHINKPTNQKGGAATELPITAEPETTAAAVAAERCSSKAPPAWSLWELSNHEEMKEAAHFYFVNFLVFR